MSGQNTRHSKTTLVWDPLLRILHWVMAASLILQCITGTTLLLLDGVLSDDVQGRLDLLHYAGGGVFAAALVTRLIWLFAGPAETGWRDFVPLTSARRQMWLDTLRYYLSGLRGSLPYSRTHNPFAATAYLAFFGLGLAQVVMGTVLATMTDEARMKSSLLEWHATGFFILLAFVAFHLTAVILREVRGREGIVSAMIHGHKNEPNEFPSDATDN